MKINQVWWRDMERHGGGERSRETEPEREKLLLRERNDHIDHGGKRERWSE